jgi:hypothetical protein
MSKFPECLFIFMGAQGAHTARRRAHVSPTADYASARTRGRKVTTTSWSRLAAAAQRQSQPQPAMSPALNWLLAWLSRIPRVSPGG